MKISRTLLCAAYGVIAVLALVGTWGNNLHYLGDGFFAANTHFWSDTLVNAASRSITVDVFFLSLAAIMWMLLEARRLKLRAVWLYVIFGLLVAISVTVPLFLIHRERALAARDGDAPAGELHLLDILGLTALAIGAIAYALATLSR